MTNDLEKQFFSAFEIEPRVCNRSCWDCEHQNYDYGLAGYCTMDTTYNECDFAKKLYPQITDRILLEIIAKICWTYRCTANDFDLYEVSTAEGLKEAVLKHAIELSKNDDYIYSSVQALFEEGKIESNI